MSCNPDGGPRKKPHSTQPVSESNSEPELSNMKHRSYKFNNDVSSTSLMKAV